MKGSMIEYYFFKDILRSLDQSLKNDFILNDSNIFNMATFINIGYYYRYNSLKKDNIKLSIKLENNENFNKFIIECIIDANLHYNPNKLMLIYGMVSSHILKTYLIPFLELKINDNQNIDDLLGMIDYIYTKKYDSFDLTKIKINKIFSMAFNYDEYMYELINYPIIKVFKCFISNNYLIKCYKKKKKFYSFYNSSLKSLKMILLSFKNIRFKKKKYDLKNNFYTNKIDTTLLKKDKQKIIINNNEYNLSLDDAINKAKEDTINSINAIHEYVLSNKDKNIRKIFNIDNDKKL